MKVTVHVYLFSGRVFEYDIEADDAPGKAREHTDAIIESGYRSTRDGELVHYPPHQIAKVKAVGEGISTSYPDRERGT